MKKSHFFSISLAWSYALLFNFLLIKPAGEGPSLMLFEHMDKLIHFFGHLILAIIFISIYASQRQKVIFLLFVQALSTELIQRFVPGRSFEIFDILANLSGIFIGLLFFRFFRPR